MSYSKFTAEVCPKGAFFFTSKVFATEPLGALGLVLNVLVHWNTIYMDAALEQLKHDGFSVNDEDAVRLSPFAKSHFNLLGRYSFSMPDEVKMGKLRPLRDPENP